MERERASAGFTARLLARTETLPVPRPHPWRRSFLRAPLAAAAALAVAGLAGFLLAPRFRDAEPRVLGTSGAAVAVRSGDEAQALRVQLQTLERELHDLQRLAAERQPLIAVEGDHADYVIDLRDFLPTTRGPSAVPASYEAPDGGRRVSNR